MIAYSELGYGRSSDGGPLDPNAALARERENYPPFRGETFDLRAALAGFDWPTVAISGGRDLRTPRDEAEYLVAHAPDAVLLPLESIGHSALDSHSLAALLAASAIRAGTHHRLPRLAERVDALPRRGRQTLVGPMIRARLVLEESLPRTT